MLKVLTVRQPWASLIVCGAKNIENRTWSTSYRGPLLIQASASLSRSELRAARELCDSIGVSIPENLPLGGIVGITRVLDCVERSDSPWFCGPIGWALSGSRELPFVAIKGQLGLFDASPAVLAQLSPDVLDLSRARTFPNDNGAFGANEDRVQQLRP